MHQKNSFVLVSVLAAARKYSSRKNLERTI